MPSIKRELLLEGKKRPGPKPGGYNPGAFKQGGDPRILPGGRNNPAYESARLEYRELVGEAVEAYRSVLSDPQHKDYLAAARDLLDRVYGKPDSESQKAQREALQTLTDAKELSETDLLRIVNGEMAQPIEGELAADDGEAFESDAVNNAESPELSEDDPPAEAE